VTAEAEGRGEYWWWALKEVNAEADARADDGRSRRRLQGCASKVVNAEVSALEEGRGK
jgi:hypothetical protein